MDWSNSHLHQFTAGERRISDPAFELDELSQDESTLDQYRVSLSEVAPKVGDHLVYLYDFGDSWFHDIEVEAISPLEVHELPVWCLDGERTTPPDDCGGIHGYEELIAAIEYPRHPRHAELLEWAGGPIDTEAFDPRRINRELARWVLNQD
jgi:hypothetical protein